MSHHEPIVVYRSRGFPAVDSLVNFLRESGINAHLVPPSNQYGQYRQAGEGPVFGFIYDVYVVDCTTDYVQTLLNDWLQQQALVSASTDLFCYLCNEVLSMLQLDLPPASTTRRLERNGVSQWHGGTTFGLENHIALVNGIGPKKRAEPSPL